MHPPKVDIEVNNPDEAKKLQKLRIKGEIDRDTIPGFREKMEEFLPTFKQDYLILDLEGLGFINSEGIGYLSDIHNRLTDLNKNVLILKASDRIMDIFQLVGLNQIISCYPTEDECLKSIS